ncbi:CARDB domain-containing protein [Halorientalis pallida]|uniref:CARDB domain-containing protein n=1 Tax=Halorientalis pallida TaxID=2479928 RepID=UPI003C6F3629
MHDTDIHTVTVTLVTLFAAALVATAGIGTAVAQVDDGDADSTERQFDFDAGPDSSVGFEFADGSPDFDFGGDDLDEPGFSFGGGGDEPGFSFGSGAGEPGFSFGGGDGDAPTFGFGDGDDTPSFGGTDGDDAPSFDFGDDGDGEPDDGDDDTGDGQASVVLVPTVTDTNSPVNETETLTVVATVENTGSGDGTGTVELTVDGQAADSRQVDLAAGASTTVSLSWTPQLGDAGEYTATVATANRSAQVPITVEPAPTATPADFRVGPLSSNSPVDVTDALDVTATVENVGGREATQTVTLDVAGSQRDSQSVTLAGGASQQVTLSWTPQSGDAGEYTATVTTANDTATTSVRVANESDGGDGGKVLPFRPSSFRGYVEGETGYLHTGIGNDSFVIDFTECRNFQPTDEYVQQHPDYLPVDPCIVLTGNVSEETDTWEGEFQTSRVTGSITDTAVGAAYYAANITTTDGVTGTFDLSTGEITGQGTAEINVTVWNVDNVGVPWVQRGDPISDDTCHIPNVPLRLSTEKSYEPKSPIPSTDLVSGMRLNDANETTVVSNDFAVGSAKDCGEVYGYINISKQINAELGIPAEAGRNELVFDFDLDLKR